jgi:hypothetical protein
MAQGFSGKEPAMRAFILVVEALSLLASSCERVATASMSATGEGGAYMLSVAVDGPGRVLSLPPAIDCPGVCSAAFASGTSVTLAASPFAEGEFADWSGACSGAMGCFVPMEAEAQVVARFRMMANPMQEQASTPPR